MKRILIFCECFFPGYKMGGIPQSMLNMVKALDESFEFFVFTRDHEFHKPDERLNVISDQWIDFLLNTKVFYTAEKKINYSFIKKIITGVSPDIIYINGLYELDFVVYPLLIGQKLNIKIVQAPRGMLQKGALSLKPFKKKVFLYLFKLFNLDKKTNWHATDGQECEDVRRMFGTEVNICLAEVIPNINLVESYPIQKEPESLSLVTISLIAEKKNHLFVLKLLKNLSFKITYHICGPVKDEAYWLECKNLIKQMPENITVIFHGPIEPKDVGKYLHESHFFILPTLGENFGHSIYEALSSGKPVIISDKTPWNNLELQNAGWDLPLNIEIFTKIITICYAMGQDEYSAMSKSAVNLAKNFIEKYNFKETYSSLFN